MSRYEVSYYYVNRFINDNGLELYKIGENEYNFVIRLFMNNVYIYIHRKNKDYFLVIEVFPYNYRLYMLKWPGCVNDFIKVINNLGIITIKTGSNSTGSNLSLGQECRILNSVLEFIVNNKEYITKRYNLK